MSQRFYGGLSMFNLIEVTDNGGIKVYVNTDHIIRFKDLERTDDGPTTYGYIKLSTGDIFCRENGDEIKELLVNMETL